MSYIIDVTHGDSGNYTCDVEGPQNKILGQTTHYVYVRGLLCHHHCRHHQLLLSMINA